MSDAHAAAIGGSWSPLSCEYLFYHAKQRDTTPASEGTTLSAIRDALEHDGQPVESGWPYLITLPTDIGQWKPPANVGTLFRRGSDLSGKVFDEIWNVVETDRAVLIGMTLSNAFFVPDLDGVVDADEPEEPTMKHAVLIVATGTRAEEQVSSHSQ